MGDKVTRQCPQTTTFEDKGEPKQIRTEVLLLTSLTPYRWAKQAHLETLFRTPVYKASNRRYKLPARLDSHSPSCVRRMHLYWRTALAYITPICKTAERYRAENNRPVSLTSIPCKVMEHIVLSAIWDFTEQQNTLRPEQHGFRRGHSCESQLHAGVCG